MIINFLLIYIFKYKYEILKVFGLVKENYIVMVEYKIFLLLYVLIL